MNDEIDAIFDDIYTEIGEALGMDDTFDYDVDFKRDLTRKIVRHFTSELEARARVESLLARYERNNDPLIDVRSVRRALTLEDQNDQP